MAYRPYSGRPPFPWAGRSIPGPASGCLVPNGAGMYFVVFFCLRFCFAIAGSFWIPWANCFRPIWYTYPPLTQFCSTNHPVRWLRSRLREHHPSIFCFCVIYRYKSAAAVSNVAIITADVDLSSNESKDNASDVRRAVPS